VVPVIERLATMVAVPISVDTRKAAVAAAALDAGAVVVNDVSAGRFDAAMLPLVADRGAGYVAMHMQGEPVTMQQDPHYDDVVVDVGDALVERVHAAAAAGVARAAIAADPGLGFGKTVAHNLALLGHLDRLVARLGELGVPILVGPSRKSFLGAVLRDQAGRGGVPGAAEREEATLAACVWAIDAGAMILRVHDVGPVVRARRLMAAMAAA
jgi:dihydropteroate synthase